MEVRHPSRLGDRHPSLKVHFKAKLDRRKVVSDNVRLKEAEILWTCIFIQSQNWGEWKAAKKQSKASIAQQLLPVFTIIMTEIKPRHADVFGQCAAFWMLFKIDRICKRTLMYLLKSSNCWTRHIWMMHRFQRTEIVHNTSELPR